MLIAEALSFTQDQPIILSLLEALLLSRAQQPSPNLSPRSNSSITCSLYARRSPRSHRFVREDRRSTEGFDGLSPHLSSGVLDLPVYHSRRYEGSASAPLVWRLTTPARNCLRPHSSTSRSRAPCGAPRSSRSTRLREFSNPAWRRATIVKRRFSWPIVSIVIAAQPAEWFFRTCFRSSCASAPHLLAASRVGVHHQLWIIRINLICIIVRLCFFFPPAHELDRFLPWCVFFLSHDSFVNSLGSLDNLRASSQSD